MCELHIIEVIHSLCVIHFVMSISTIAVCFKERRLSFISYIPRSTSDMFSLSVWLVWLMLLWKAFSFIVAICTTVFTLMFSHFPSLVTLIRILRVFIFQEAFVDFCGKEMSLKLFMLLATIVLVAYGDDVERKGNKNTCRITRYVKGFRYLYLRVSNK